MKPWEVIWELFGRTPKPPKRTRRPRGSADCAPCAARGRTVAHTKDGRAYLHRCEAKEGA